MHRPAAAQPTTREGALIALVAIAAWSILPPYLGPLLGLELNVSSRIEVIDHVVPGVCALAAACFALAYARRGETDSIRVLAAFGVCALAGLFQTTTHVPLMADAGSDVAPVGSVLLHSIPGPVLLVLSVWLLLRPAPAEPARR